MENVCECNWIPVRVWALRSFMIWGSNLYIRNLRLNLVTTQSGFDPSCEKNAWSLNRNSILTWPSEDDGINYQRSCGMSTPITPDKRGIYIYALLDWLVLASLYMGILWNLPFNILLVGRFVNIVLWPLI